jgi:Family of unknown function (DUF5681)
MTKTYDVGYGRPPKQHQFKAGQSGNPSGRPKGVRSLKSDLRDELAELVAIKDGNKTIELTRQRAVLKAVVKSALEGDLRAANIVLNLCSDALASGANSPPDEMDLDPADQAIAEASAARQRKSNPDFNSQE